MPAGMGASYRSLGDLGEDVYKSTTIAEHQHNGAGHNVLESVKKVFSFAAPRVELGLRGKKDQLIQDKRESVSIVSRSVKFHRLSLLWILRWWVFRDKLGYAFDSWVCVKPDSLVFGTVL
ncbi:hypothetical protein QAD02_004322 [Eretmocerus hayati]|uniref:Uncharacterized protein n=1 Tax=Eretmocerus hayati TaxID=131215 RepID=A0ACC2NR03_9HYME|nr:hypothetical protein QAD02_004322 [Eretmocerus hayati]